MPTNHYEITQLTFNGRNALIVILMNEQLRITGSVVMASIRQSVQSLLGIGLDELRASL